MRVSEGASVIVIEAYVVALAALMFVVALLGLPSAEMSGRVASVIQLAFGFGLVGVVLLVVR